MLRNNTRTEAFMAHSNARLNFHGRCLLVERVRVQGMPVSHVAKAMGISRQCAHRWVARFDHEGYDGLHDRSSRPRRSPSATDEATIEVVVRARAQLRQGPALLSAATGIPARTISRILARAGIPRLAVCDPMTGEVIRSSKATSRRYERARPGELVHMDVKKIGRIPAGGGWRAHGRSMGSTAAAKRARIGFDYVHSVVDDHNRLAYSEILPNEQGATCAGFLNRAAAWFAERGISTIEEVMTDNHYSYAKSNDMKRVIAQLGARHIFIRPHCPWQNGKVERFNRTLQVEWAYRQVFLSNRERSLALAPWLQRYNYERPHTSLGGRPPISRVS
jgi:transposase InsO family protein